VRLQNCWWRASKYYFRKWVYSTACPLREFAWFSSTLLWAVLTGPADWVCHIGTLTPCIEAVAYSYIMVEWCWWDSSLIWKTNWFL